MKRREAIASQTEMEVLDHYISQLDRKITRLEQSPVVTLQADNYFAMSDPVAFESLVHHPGIHVEANPESSVVYYHPGQEDETGVIVDPGWKAIGGSPFVAWAWADGHINDEESIPAGLNRIHNDIGFWNEIQISGTDTFAYQDPNNNIYGSPIRLLRPGRYIQSLWFQVPPVFSNLFDFAVYIENIISGPAFVQVYNDANMMMRTSLWASGTSPVSLSTVGTLDFDDATDPEVPDIWPTVVFNNLSGGTTDFGGGGILPEISLTVAYLGQVTNNLIDTNYP